ncbi:MAG: hypothetical protein F4Y42_14645 [Caldilineaceae bacterium SB0664_bin_27]|uniref:Uncharacterized protein n=1 Tax=Caldilineaceae bacterium SB0664_bin_27 TaxID=2605260 RepID=A0A6B0YVN5_9CHLR|nr:hypothetical protein [Caldilineaceae bacterium SB0664_bin_27]
MSEENYRNSGSDAQIDSRCETDSQDPARPNKLTPSEWMRNRRPNLFSDSSYREFPQVSKEHFEYHLETLTSRKQEFQFEHFCRKLAEREICPNLRPQTGPTGGGDSKVDSETYPVAEEIVERWWIGTPSAGKERWAFAFSAKSEWKSKVKNDVKKILSTGRAYKRIYFFSNQYVSDKKRADEEDSLSKETGIPVHIVDRSWIVEKVYDADHQQRDSYFAALDIGNVSREKKARPGPRDTARLEELEKLDMQVADPSRYQSARYQLVEDCLRSALLARGLERSRSEVEARFLQADRLARELDHNRQRLRIAYSQAWTVYWWYEDYTEFDQLYDIVERRAKKSDQASDVDLLYTLWTLLPSLVDQIQDTRFESRSQRLEAMLANLADESRRPNNALQARTSLTLMRTMLAYHSGKSTEAEEGWRNLSKIVDRSEGLGAYSVEYLFDLAQEFGDFIDSPAFDVFYEKIVDTMSKRRGEGEAGTAYFRRASQKLEKRKPYESIQLFGRAEELLIKREYRRELWMTLLGISHAFERVGLLWAARNKALAASDLALEAFKEQGQLTPSTLMALRWLVWLELKLGRLPHILKAISFSNLVAAQLDLPEDRLEVFDEERTIQEGVLGIHFLNLPMDALSNVTRLPNTLQELGLDLARIALLFVLGHEHVLREEEFLEDCRDAETAQSFFELWQDQPAAEDIPFQPTLVDGKTSTLRSTILGSEIVIETPNNEVSFGIAESLLSTLEAFLSTCDDREAFPYRERVTIVVSPSAQLHGTPQIIFPDNDSGSILITHPADICFKTAAERQDFMEWLRETLLQIACSMLMIRAPEGWAEQAIGKERGFSRALTSGNSLALTRSLFGEPVEVKLSDWIKQDDQNYEVLRDRPWRTEKTASESNSMESVKFSSDSPPASLFEREHLKHTDQRVLTPIDTHLWNRALWRGTVFERSLDPGNPPILAIGFEDGEAGNEIFRAWKGRWGNIDEDNMIRVVIITGLSERKPADYAVAVGPNFRHMAETGKKAFTVISRVNRMSPPSSMNLDNFITAYREAGSFFLAPVLLSTSKQIVGVPSRQLAIAKWQLDIRKAWQIGDNDPDISVLSEDDDPIIPPGVSDPPVHKALRQIRALRERRQ